jgi:hypothetical protein
MRDLTFVPLKAIYYIVLLFVNAFLGGSAVVCDKQLVGGW